MKQNKSEQGKTKTEQTEVHPRVLQHRTELTGCGAVEENTGRQNQAKRSDHSKVSIDPTIENPK